MNILGHKPIISLSREELERKLRLAKDAVTTLENELAQRHPDDKWQWGYLGKIPSDKPGIQTAYKYFNDRDEAVKAYMTEYECDFDTAVYRIQKVYLDKEQTNEQ